MLFRRSWSGRKTIKFGLRGSLAGCPRSFGPNATAADPSPAIRTKDRRGRFFLMCDRRTVSDRENSISSPDHRDGRGQTTAHVEGEESLGAFDLTRARLSGELLISIKHLPHAGRTDWMTIADQTTSRVHRNLERKFAALLISHLRKRSRATLRELRAFALLGQSQNFVGDNLRD